MDDRERITNAQQYIQGIRNSRDTLADILIDAGFDVDDDDKLQDLIEMFDSLPINRIGDPDDLTTVHKETLVAAINELDANIKSLELLDIQVVDQLPTQDISDTTIYLIPKGDPAIRNAYEEWLHTNAKWEKIGDTEVDLSNYATLDDLTSLRNTLETLINTKANQSDLNTTNTNLSNLTSRVTNTESDIVSINNRLNNIKGIINASNSNNVINLNNYTETGTYLLVGSYYTPKNNNVIGIAGGIYKPVDGGILRVFNDTTNNKVIQYLETENYSSNLHVNVIYRRDIINSSWEYDIIPKIDDLVDEVGSSNPDDYRFTTSSNMRLHDKFNIINNTKQDNLVSGTNIKTINGNNITGSGDLKVKKDIIISKTLATNQIDTYQIRNADNTAKFEEIYRNFENLTDYNVVMRSIVSESGACKYYKLLSIEKTIYNSTGTLTLNFDAVDYGYTNTNGNSIGKRPYFYIVLQFDNETGSLTSYFQVETKIINWIAHTGNYLSKSNTSSWTPTNDYNPVHKKYVDDAISEIDLTTKQDALVSGTNIKTVNNTSLLGSGDITVKGVNEITTDTYLSSLDIGNYAVSKNVKIYLRDNYSSGEYIYDRDYNFTLIITGEDTSDNTNFIAIGRKLNFSNDSTTTDFVTVITGYGGTTTSTKLYRLPNISTSNTSDNGMYFDTSGNLMFRIATYNDSYAGYLRCQNYMAISKGTLENVITGKQLIDQTALNNAISSVTVESCANSDIDNLFNGGSGE